MSAIAPRTESLEPAEGATIASDSATTLFLKILVYAAGFVASVRGRSGGIKLAKPADEINIGDVVATIEPDFHVAECFHKATCSFLPSCKLRGLLAQARTNFMQTLGNQMLSEIIAV